MTPAGTSNELDVQNEWEENTHILAVNVCTAVLLGSIPRLLNSFHRGREVHLDQNDYRAYYIKHLVLFFSTNSSRGVDCDRKKRFLFRGII